MGRVFGNDNPGLGGFDELTTAEELFVQGLAGLAYEQGDILYYDGVSLTRLAPGTSGQFLKTQGAAADPIWANATATVATLDDVGDVTLTSVAQGDILYRNASGAWVNLAPGTSGHFLKTQGAAADPIWSAVTATPGGANTQVQFNDAGSLSGEADLTWNKTSNALYVAGTIELGHATDTTLSRSAAGVLAVEGVDVATISGTQALSNKTIGNTNTVTLKDTLFTIQDDGDATKLLAFQLSGITTGTTRTITIPDASGTATLLGNTSTGSGSVVLATSPTITTPTVSGDLTISGGAIQAESQILFNSAVYTQFQANQANVDLSFKTVAGTGNIVFTPNAVDAVKVTNTGLQILQSHDLVMYGSTSGTTTVKSGAVAGSSVLTLPVATDTLVGKTTTDILTNKTLTAAKIADAGYLADGNGNEYVVFHQTASAVNQVEITNSATTTAPTISVGGGDTNIDLKLSAKGTGKIAPQASINFGAKTAYFTETDNGNSGTADTIDWTLSNKQKSTLTGNVTFTFTAPPGPCSLILKLIQDATGSRTVTWPAAVHWPGGTAPTLTTTASKVDIISFYYDGTTYFGNSSLNFTA